MTHKAKDWIYKPNSINIETVQGCNRRCEFCGTMGMEKTLHFAELSTIQHTLNLIRQAGYYPRIRLAAHGEPTLHPQICEIVRMVRKTLPRSPISLFTNGTVIEKKPALVDDLFNAGLNNMVVDEYSDHLVGKFIRNDPTCKKYNIVDHRNGVSMLIGVKPKDRRICIVPPIDGGETASHKLCNQCGAALPPLKTPYNKRCSVIFREMIVRWDGNIAICCNDFRGYYPVTNILNCKYLEDAWFHPRFESARKILYKGERSAFFPCNICDVKGNRVGLLPDCAGQKEMPEPTEKDYEIVRKKFMPLAKIEKRPWEV